MVSQRSCVCLIPGSILGQVGWGSEQPNLVNGNPDYGRGLELGDLSGHLQPKPFGDSMILYSSSIPDLREHTSKVKKVK